MLQVVSKYIEEKTVIDDRRHTTITTEGEVVLNMVMSLSKANLYRKCLDQAKTKNIHHIPSYVWFLLQFWPSAKNSCKDFSVCTRTG